MNLTDFHKYTTEKGLIKKEDRILCALSGGIDSVVLCHLLHRAKINFAIAHVHYGLRGKESDKDELFVKSLALKYNVPYFLNKPQTKVIAAKNQLSIQMAARLLRYEWFDFLLKKEKYTKIATAHHLNDSLETSIFNLTKGSSLRGIRGIPELSQDIIRPLLNFTRLEIESYARENNLEWREDQSNREDKYARNKIRLNVIPELKKINPSIEDTYRYTKIRLDKAQLIVDEFIENIRTTVFSKSKNYDQFDFKNFISHPALDYIVQELTRPYQVQYRITEDICRALQTGNSGKEFYTEDFLLSVQNKKIFVYPRVKEVEQRILQLDKSDFQIKINEQYLLESTSGKGNYIIDKTSSKAFIDADKLTFPLTIRPIKEGDVFRPIGMKGMKKLSDFLIDQKIPKPERKNIQLLCDAQDHIIWVIGLRPDDRFKIDANTKRWLLLELKAQV